MQLIKDYQFIKNLYEVRRGRLMGRGIPSELADTTKPGCDIKLLYIAMFVKTFLNFVERHKCSNLLSMPLKI
ncbi:MAG: hypothetical protein EBW42_04410 [Rhodobacterales bacterium]|nr:hypothetical protein [Rhodobacterales bacterium]